MDRQELIVLFVVGIIAVIAILLMYKNIDATGDAVYPSQVRAQSGASCYVDSDCYWTYNDLNYECRVGICKPKAALGPPKYVPRLKLR